MVKILDQLIANCGGRENLHSMKKGGVPRSNEFKRIESLPRRIWEKDPNLGELVELTTNWLKTEKGTMKLWPIQAAALRDIYEQNGLFAPIPVGGGKTLISLLAATVRNVKRPVLLVPAYLRDKTNYELPKIKKHWKIHNNLKIIGYSEIQLTHKAKLLEELNPDMLILDEAHSVKNLSTARGKRVKRYIEQNPNTFIVALSGTMTKKSLMDYWHLLLWTHKDMSPIPRYWHEVQDWSKALDSGVDEFERIPGGALHLFCEKGETIRQGYGRRLSETPGIVAGGEKELGVSLIIRHYKINPLPIKITQAITKMTTTWETPNGDFITEAIDLWRHLREISLGFWYKWEPSAPREWLDARRNWKAYVRETLRHNRRNLDSELQVWNECILLDKNNKLVHTHPWYEYKDVKDTFKINTVPIWISDFAIKQAAKWLKENEGICWTEHTAFGKALSKYSGYPYYGKGKQASLDILTVTGPIIASIKAQSEGKNMQDRYSKNLIVSCPSSGTPWEQIIGRTHRYGQQAEEVEVDVFMYTDEHKTAFKTALEDARYIEPTMGRQKLLYASIL